jgi:hypothetical protein
MRRELLSGVVVAAPVAAVDGMYCLRAVGLRPFTDSDFLVLFLPTLLAFVLHFIALGHARIETSRLRIRGRVTRSVIFAFAGWLGFANDAGRAGVLRVQAFERGCERPGR